MSALLLACTVLSVWDGDGPIRCRGERMPLRLDAVDAPELRGSPRCHPVEKPGAWCDYALGIVARDHLRALLASGKVEYRLTGKRTWDRQVAKVYVNGQDVECLMVKANLAVVRYGELRGCGK